MQAKIDAQLATPPMDVVTGPAARALATTEFVPVRLHGTVLGGEAVALGHMKEVAPVVLADGVRVMAMGHKGQFSGRGAAGGAAGKTGIEGFTRLPERPSKFTPDDNGDDGGKGVWYWADVPKLAAKFDAVPVLVDVGAEVAGEPVTNTQLRDMHAIYAATWFTLATGMFLSVGSWCYV